MMTMRASSGIVRRRSIGSSSERLLIWKTDMDSANLPPIGSLPRARTFASTARVLKKLSHKLAGCRRKRRGYQELAAMSDIELEDLGIGRADIDAIVAGTYERANQNPSNVIVLDQRAESPPSGSAKPRKR